LIVTSSASLTVPLVLAGAFGTFLLFVVLGLGALAVTAALDRVLGKERALLLYAVALLVFTWVVLKDRAAVGSDPIVRQDTVLAQAAAKREMRPNLLARPPFQGTGDDERRNGFARVTDTRPLPPVELELPPEVSLDFPLPPTVPGPGPAARRLLRGPLPELSTHETSSPLEVTPIRFDDYQLKPDDVYDVVEKDGRPLYVAIVALNGVRASDPSFKGLLRQLVAGEDADRLQVEWAMIGSAEQAMKGGLDPAVVAKRSQGNRSTDPAKRFDRWILKRTVENLYAEALRQELGSENLEAVKDVSRLMRAAQRMADVGATGKEGGAGWTHAVRILERAFAVSRESQTPEAQAEVLVALIHAYRAVKDEQAALRALTAYAQAMPTRSQPWVWLGDLALQSLGLPDEALLYYAKARSIDPQSEAVALGEGDAFTQLGRHKDAAAAYARAGGGFAAQVRKSEAALRLGELSQARSAADAALSSQPDHPRALLARGGVLYAQGDLAGARGAFSMAAASTAENAVWRAQALYDLGLTAWRLGETRAALGAFDACEAALKLGASPGRSDDEMVSPSLGRALVALALKAPDPASEASAGAGEATPAVSAPLAITREQVGSYLSAARDEARRVSYLEHVAGVLASQQGNTAAAIRSLRRALVLAPDSTELDGWLAVNHLRWGFATAGRAAASGEGAGPAADEAQTVERVLAMPSGEHFAAAVAFAVRAAESDLVDPKAFRAQLRECWVRLQAEHLSPRRRFEAAREAAEKVLKRSDLREQPAALCMRAFASYRLGGDEMYDSCQQDLGLVLDKVPEEPVGPWTPWRRYAEATLARVKHWRSLEEKVVSFEGLTQLTKEWLTFEKGGVRVRLEGGLLTFEGKAEKDGSVLEPIAAVVNQTLFDKAQFEELRLKIRIPATQEGSAANNIVFGIGVQGTTSTSGQGAAGVAPRHPGISIFYDKARVAARVGTGRQNAWKDGEVHRKREDDGAERPWPSGEWVDVRIVREDAKEGVMAIYLGGDQFPVVSDHVSGFKGVSGKAELWIGGWSASATPYEVQLKDIRIVRKKK
jgi:tetratricopeptide (TPR) repeat protein